MGVEVRPNGIALAKATAERGHIESYGFAECTAAKRLETLRLLVEAHGCEGAACNLVLMPDQYQLYQVERPAVEAAELAEAIRWRIKDLVDGSISDAVLDVFEFPADASRNRGAMLNVAVARKAMIKEFIQLIGDAGLNLSSIDISELALRNLLLPVDNPVAGRVILLLRRGQGLLTIIRDGNLYLSRRLDFDLSAMADADRVGSAGEQLALEVQRSLDYYESQLKQGPVTQILVAAREHGESVLQQLSRNLGVPVAVMPFARFVADEVTDPGQLVGCLAAAGGALREELG